TVDGVMGVDAASTQWFFADGATGTNLDTFFLFVNPQTTPATVMMTYLIDGNGSLTVQKTVPAQGRLATSAIADSDRLRGASFDTIIQSDAAIVVERAMSALGAGHNVAGITDPGTKWALAEGRVGGSQQFRTFITLANPQTQPANVTVFYLRETGD